MPHWIIKATIQGTLARLPDPQRWNRLFQKYVTHSLELKDEYFLSKWEQCETHVKKLCEQWAVEDASGLEFTSLELGTGWFPIAPVGMALNGAAKSYSIDLQDLLKHECVVATLEQYAKHIASGTVTVRDPEALQRLTRVLAKKDLLDARGLLAQLGIEAVVRDAADSGLPNESIDLIFSNNTLEHIPRNVIVGIMGEFKRLVSPRGIMSHHIDLADHYVNFDSSITVYNFLRFSEQRWKWFNNSLQYQNRLRVGDFREIHREAGWEVVDEDNIAEPLEVLRSVPIAEDFAHMSEEDLAVYVTWMLSKANGGQQIQA